VARPTGSRSRHVPVYSAASDRDAQSSARRPVARTDLDGASASYRSGPWGPVPSPGEVVPLRRRTWAPGRLQTPNKTLPAEAEVIADSPRRSRVGTRAGLEYRDPNDAGVLPARGPVLLLAKPAHVGPEVSGDTGLPPYTSLSRATGSSETASLSWAWTRSQLTRSPLRRTAQGADGRVDGRVDCESTLEPPNSPAAPGLSARLRPRLPAPHVCHEGGCG
jgi:hypothetical protein